jgi:urease accessory protein
MKFLLAAFVLVVLGEPAAAHHVMGGMMPMTFMQGLLSGLGHPVIGLDHFAAMLAVGCLAAWQTRGPQLIIAYVVAMAAGAAFHVQGTSLAGDEIMVALSVLALGTALLRSVLSAAVLFALFVVAGLINGYALGETIAGAEPAPL